MSKHVTRRVAHAALLGSITTDGKDQVSITTEVWFVIPLRQWDADCPDGANHADDAGVTATSYASRMHVDLIEKETTRDIIGAFFEVYNTLGYGFPEFVYSLAMERELVRSGHKVEREVSVPIFYKGELLTNLRADMIVDGKVVVANKTGAVLPVTTRLQALSYVKSTRLEVGLVLHFGPEATSFRVVHSNNE